MKLITPDDIRHKALRIWRQGDVCHDWLHKANSFPRNIAFRKPTASEMLENFEQVRDWISVLRQHSKLETGKGYRLGFTQSQHRKMGKQQLPSCIEFETSQDFLIFIGKTKGFATFTTLAEQTLKDFPELQPWFNQYPMKVLEHAESWMQLLRVCHWFKVNPRPNRYIRELEIEEVDSKFIEQHKGILSELLRAILPENAVDASVAGLARHGFERRFGLKYDEPLIRFRLLGENRGFSDMSVPFSQFSTVEPDVSTIFITENKTNGLSFPEITDGMVIFGLGYGIEMLKEVLWLQNKRIIYWGDIDTHGFAIMSQIRTYFPQVKSLCMDKATLMAHRTMWVEEPEDKRCMHDLAHLTEDEQALLKNLQSDQANFPVRLEQERISHTWLREMLNRYV